MVQHYLQMLRVYGMKDRAVAVFWLQLKKTGYDMHFGAAISNKSIQYYTGVENEEPRGAIQWRCATTLAK